MNRASPVEARKALEVAHVYAHAGIPFVPMPVASEEERNARVQEANDRLEQIAAVGGES